MYYKSEGGFTLRREDDDDNGPVSYSRAHQYVDNGRIFTVFLDDDDAEPEEGLVFIPRTSTIIGGGILLIPASKQEAYSISAEDIAAMIRLYYYHNSGQAFTANDLKTALQLFDESRE